jgi:hypothetical protein
VYLLFLLWCAFPAAELTNGRQGFAAGYRGSMSAAAGLLFLYVLNTPRDRLRPDTAVEIMAKAVELREMAPPEEHTSATFISTLRAATATPGSSYPG